MGDLWLPENEIYHPVNIKTGITDQGQPNMVALRKLLKHILQNQIDSYYLLMIKFVINESIIANHRVYFIDMLDYLDYLSFDSGPGQIMLKAKDFHQDFDSLDISLRNLPEKADYLMDLLRDGDERLFVNRAEKRNQLQIMADQYKNRINFTVTPQNQEEFNLG